MSKDKGTRTKQLVLQELLEIVVLLPDQNISSIICGIMRPYSEAFAWDDELLLKKIEKYRAEVEDKDEEEDD